MQKSGSRTANKIRLDGSFTFLKNFLLFDVIKVGKGGVSVAIDYKFLVPLHVQLKEIIEKQGTDGVFSGQIPSERQLMEQYNY